MFLGYGRRHACEWAGTKARRGGQIDYAQAKARGERFPIKGKIETGEQSPASGARFGELQ
jgi:hypothetical protein